MFTFLLEQLQMSSFLAYGKYLKSNLLTMCLPHIMANFEKFIINIKNDINNINIVTIMW